MVSPGTQSLSAIVVCVLTSAAFLFFGDRNEPSQPSRDAPNFDQIPQDHYSSNAVSFPSKRPVNLIRLPSELPGHVVLFGADLEANRDQIDSIAMRLFFEDLPYDVGLVNISEHPELAVVAKVKRYPQWLIINNDKSITTMNGQFLGELKASNIWTKSLGHMSSISLKMKRFVVRHPSNNFLE